jgi:aspartate aminotransferase-like enzyme
MKTRLFTPGPTPVPQDILLEMAKPITHHRLPIFEKSFAKVNEGLKFLFQTQNDVYTLTSSGTGGMEATVSNLFSRGDHVLVVRGGKFGERWGELCEAYGVEFTPIDIDWGKSIDPQLIDDTLGDLPDIKAVFTTQSETSTGALNDIEAIGEVVKNHDVMLIVDAITGIGVHSLKFDEWGVDAAVTGSQKGLMIPPGLAFVALSDKAWGAVGTSDLPKFYFSFEKAKKALGKGQNPFTPALTLIMGLEIALRQIEAEGLDQLFKRHERLAEAIRTGVRALGLELLAENPSNVLTAVRVPEGIDGKALVGHLRNELGILFAGGQGHLKGKIFRIAHIGFFDDFDLLTAIGGLERALKAVGHDLKLGAGLAATQDYLGSN